MSSRAASWLLAGLLLSGAAAAETIVVDGQVAVRPTNVGHPTRGSTMTAVEQRFGAPNSRHAAVGQPRSRGGTMPGSRCSSRTIA